MNIPFSYKTGYPCKASAIIDWDTEFAFQNLHGISLFIPWIPLANKEIDLAYW